MARNFELPLTWESAARSRAMPPVSAKAPAAVFAPAGPEPNMPAIAADPAPASFAGRTIAGPGGHDLGDRLPEPARQKLLAIRDDAAAMRGALDAALASKEAARLTRQEWHGRLQALAAPGVRGVRSVEAVEDSGAIAPELFPKIFRTPGGQAVSKLDEKHASVAQAVARYRRADAEYRHHEAVCETRAPRWAALAGLLENAIEPWLRALPSDAEVAMHAPAIDAKLKKGEIAVDAVERCRREISELRADLHQLRSSPIPSADAKARARAEIAALAERGRPDCHHMAEAGLPIAWPRQTARVDIVTAGGPPGLAFVENFDAAGLMAWLFQDQLGVKVDAEIDELSDDEHALDDKTRARREAEILATILEAERQEESFIEAAGGSFLRRVDADPRAVLGLSSALPASRQSY